MVISTHGISALKHETTGPTRGAAPFWCSRTALIPNLSDGNEAQSANFPLLTVNVRTRGRCDVLPGITEGKTASLSEVQG